MSIPSIFKEHIGFWTKERKKSLYTGILFLLVAMTIQFFAGGYSGKRATNFNFVGDIFLDNIPMLNLTFIVVEGGFLFILIGFALLVLKPRYLIFTLKTVSFFVIIRSFFVSLTHLGIYPNEIVFGTGIIDRIYTLLNLHDGFFFSAHTGLPFLAALIFWQERLWRYVFLTVSFTFAITVLLAHVHYSIDVFAAPFMTYAIFKLAELELFKKDYAILSEQRTE